VQLVVEPVTIEVHDERTDARADIDHDRSAEGPLARTRPVQMVLVRMRMRMWMWMWMWMSVVVDDAHGAPTFNGTVS
jgi:hypothetical protein